MISSWKNGLVHTYLTAASCPDFFRMSLAFSDHCHLSFFFIPVDADNLLTVAPSPLNPPWSLSFVCLCLIATSTQDFYWVTLDSSEHCHISTVFLSSLIVLVDADHLPLVASTGLSHKFHTVKSSTRHN